MKDRLMTEEAPAAALYTCKACGPLPLDHFHESARTRFVHRCKECTRKKNADYFQAAKGTTLKEWRMRRRVSGGLKITKLKLAEVFEVYGRRCFITGLVGPLTLIRADPAGEFTSTNAVPVLSKLAKLPHLPEASLAQWRRVRHLVPSLRDGGKASSRASHQYRPPRLQATPMGTASEEAVELQNDEAAPMNALQARGDEAEVAAGLGASGPPGKWAALVTKGGGRIAL